MYQQRDAIGVSLNPAKRSLDNSQAVLLDTIEPNLRGTIDHDEMITP
jgi:hypothetical protein